MAALLSAGVALSCAPCRDAERVKMFRDAFYGPVLLHQEMPAQAHHVHLTVAAGAVYDVVAHELRVRVLALNTIANVRAPAHPSRTLQAPCHTLIAALDDTVALAFREGGQHVELQPPGGCAGVEGLRDAHQAHTSAL